MTKRNVRIRDIAAMASVSVGTVDRVLHNRGNVSQDALLKVNEVLTKIDYKPNLIARTLGSNKTYHIAVLMPDFNLDPFWVRSHQGVQDAYHEFAHFGLGLQVFLFDPHEVQSFRKKALDLLSENPDGVVLAPLFYHEARQFMAACQEKKIRCVAFNTQVPEGRALGFIGQDLTQSGRLAAHLVGKNAIVGDRFLIFHIEEEFGNALHLRQKEAGFRQYFIDKQLKEGQVSSIELDDDARDKMAEKVLEAVRSAPGLKGIFVTTSKTHYIAKVLEEAGLDQYELVGYDLLDENLYYLKKGTIGFLIHQNPRRQAYLGMAHLTGHLVFGKDVPEVDMLPLDVITKENVGSYLNSMAH